MNPNPGGILALCDVVGRDTPIRRYWQILERQSLVLSAERRIGKTHLVRKMESESQPGFKAFYRDLEGISRSADFAQGLYRTVSGPLPARYRATATALAAIDKLMPSRVKDIALPSVSDHSMTIVTAAIEAALKNLPADRVLLIWDEVPLMLHDIAAKEGPRAAIQILDHLRNLRQQHGHRLRFLFTGSIGLHLVLRELRASGGTNDSTNDMAQETVPPLSPEDSLVLARALLEGLKNRPVAVAPVAARVVEAVGGFPYYIHHIVDQLSLLTCPITVDDVPTMVDRLICSPEDPAHIGYYVDRLRTYYGANATDALLLLDELARADAPLTMTVLAERARLANPELTNDATRDLCDLLTRDHYLNRTRGASGLEVGFRWPFIRLWWRSHRA